METRLSVRTTVVSLVLLGIYYWAATFFSLSLFRTEAHSFEWVNVIGQYSVLVCSFFLSSTILFLIFKQKKLVITFQDTMRMITQYYILPVLIASLVLHIFALMNGGKDWFVNKEEESALIFAGMYSMLFLVADAVPCVLFTVKLSKMLGQKILQALSAIVLLEIIGYLIKWGVGGTVLFGSWFDGLLG